VNLLEQVNKAAGRNLMVVIAEDVRAELGVGRKEFYDAMKRNGRVVNMREFVNGQVKPKGFLMIVITEKREGLVIQLLESLL